jgi:hypothetical protein
VGGAVGGWTGWSRGHPGSAGRSSGA